MRDRLKIKSFSELATHLKSQQPQTKVPESEPHLQGQSARSRAIDAARRRVIQRGAEEAERRAEAERVRMENEARDQRRKCIREECERRNIRTLVHFTDVRNLDSILRTGLRTLQDLRRGGMPVIVSDPHRYDGHLNSISLSVEFPNYEMFYKKRKEDPAREWAVIGIDRRVLWELDCAFYPENAASRAHRSREDYRTAERFLSLFSDYQDISRASLVITDRFPTHPQSEVLVFDGIPSDLFRFVRFENRTSEYDRFRAHAGNHDVGIDGWYFLPRADWQYWSSRKQQATRPDFSAQLIADYLPF